MSLDGALVEIPGERGMPDRGFCGDQTMVLVGHGPDPPADVLKGITYLEGGTAVAKEQGRFWNSSSLTLVNKICFATLQGRK